MGSDSQPPVHGWVCCTRRPTKAHWLCEAGRERPPEIEGDTKVLRPVTSMEWDRKKRRIIRVERDTEMGTAAVLCQR